jgi:hypothetical protein
MKLSETVLLATWIGAIPVLSLAYADEPSKIVAASQASANVPYVTGGIGADQVAGLFAHSSEYDLRVVFALQPGHAFVTDVPVRVFAQTGKEIIATDHAGPLLFANLPSGTYRIETARRGSTLTQTAKVVEGRQTKVAFYWPDTADAAAATSIHTQSPRVVIRPATIDADRELPLPVRRSDWSAGPLGIRVERLWSAGGMTYAAVSVRNTTSESLVKIDVSCQFAEAGADTVAPASRTILSPGEKPMPPGMIRNATVMVGKTETGFQPVSCDARAL